MTALTSVRLLGEPAIRSAGSSSDLRGHKAWGIVAYLISAERPVARRVLAELLFENADDPLRALRWNLTEIRKSLPVVTEGDAVAIDRRLVATDVDVLQTGTLREVLALEGLGRDLLEGIALDSPSFEVWLLNERHHVRTGARAALREGALAAMAEARYPEAVGLATRLVAMDVLDESAHALLVRSYAIAGDHRSAELQIARCRRILEEELGVSPGRAVTEAARVSPASMTGAARGGRAAVAAQQEAGDAAIRAGAYEAGLECLRRAAAEAHALGDKELKAETLLHLGVALLHGGRGDRAEGAAALHETIALGNEADVRAAAAELAWNDLLDGRYGRATRWLDDAVPALESDARVLWMRGKIAMETGSYALSIDLLQQARSAARERGDLFRESFALISLGRSHLVRGSTDEAHDILSEAVGMASSRATVLLPLARALLAEAFLANGDVRKAASLAEQAHALALEIGDVTMFVLSSRAHARALRSAGMTDRAVEMLVEARTRYASVPDHAWSLVYAMDALADMAVATASPDASRWVDEQQQMAAACGMRDLLARALLHRHALGEPDALPAAEAIAAGVDSPALHAVIDASRSTQKRSHALTS